MKRVLFVIAELCLLAVFILTFASHARGQNSPPAAYAMTVADLNGDGNLDAVVTNPCTSEADCGGGIVSVMLGKGDGTFQAGETYSSGGYNARGVAVADLNGDGFPDIVVANGCVSISNCSTGSVGVLLGNGDGTFQPAVSYGSGGMYAYSVAIGSLRGSSKLDLIVANVCATGSSSCTNGAQNRNLGVSSFCTVGSVNCANVAGAIGVLLGNGDGTFASPASYGSGGISAFSVALGNLGTGHLSVVATNSCASSGDCSHGTVAVLLGNGDGTLQSAVAYSAGALDTEYVVVGDFNGDGKLDLAVVSDCAATICADSGSPATWSYSVLLGNGDGTFGTAAAHTLNGAGWPVTSLTALDVNGDGKLDLIIGMVTASVGGSPVLLGNGNGTFATPVYFPTTNYGQTNPLTVGDVNNDGKPDLVFVNLYNYAPPAIGGHDYRSALSLLGSGTGTFAPPSVSFSSNPLAFGTVASGTENETLTVTNVGSGNVSLLGATITGTGAAQFSVLPYVSGTQSTCLKSGLQLAPTSTCTLTLQFTSTGTGVTYSNTLSVTDGGTASPQLVKLTAKD